MNDLAFREPEDILDSPLGHDLAELEAKIREGEATAIEARWLYGHKLLRRKVGKQMPKGLVPALVARDGVSEREIQYRVKFAEKCSTQEEVRTAVRTYGSWHEIRTELLTESSGGSTSTEPAFVLRRYRTAIEGTDESEINESWITEAEKLIATLRDRIDHHRATTPKAAAK